MYLQASELNWGLSVNKLSDVKCSEVGLSDVIVVNWSELQWCSCGLNCFVHSGDFVLKFLGYTVAM